MMNNLNHMMIDEQREPHDDMIDDMMDHSDSLFDQFEGSKA